MDTYPIVVGCADTDEVALVDAVDVELLEDGVRRDGLRASEDSGDSEGGELRHRVENGRKALVLRGTGSEPAWFVFVWGFYDFLRSPLRRASHGSRMSSVPVQYSVFFCDAPAACHPSPYNLSGGS